MTFAKLVHSKYMPWSILMTNTSSPVLVPQLIIKLLIDYTAFGLIICTVLRENITSIELES